jgi:hypothetical protein
VGEISTQNDVQVVDMQLHMAVKSLAIIQGEINCKLRELVKKAELITEKEEEGEESNYLLEMILDDLNELTELFNQRKNLRNQIENLKLTVGKMTKK